MFCSHVLYMLTFLSFASGILRLEYLELGLSLFQYKNQLIMNSLQKEDRESVVFSNQNNTIT